MAIKYIIVLFVETPRKFITAKLSIRKPGSSSVLITKIRYYKDVTLDVFRVITRDHNTYWQNGGETEYNSCHRDARAI
jgi:hypothetical protein